MIITGLLFSSNIMFINLLFIICYKRIPCFFSFSWHFKSNIFNLYFCNFIYIYIHTWFLFNQFTIKYNKQQTHDIHTLKNSLNDSSSNITFLPFLPFIVHFPFSTNPPITRARNPPPLQKKGKKFTSKLTNPTQMHFRESTPGIIYPLNRKLGRGASPMQIAVSRIRKERRKAWWELRGRKMIKIKGIYLTMGAHTRGRKSIHQVTGSLYSTR